VGEPSAAAVEEELDGAGGPLRPDAGSGIEELGGLSDAAEEVTGANPGCDPQPHGEPVLRLEVGEQIGSACPEVGTCAAVMPHRF
jgi:hypothetical protein